MRVVGYPPRITSDSINLAIIGTANRYSSVQLSSTTDDTKLLPGRIIPDGNGGVLATWTVSPDTGPMPTNPFQASHVVGGAPGAPYNLPFTPKTVSVGNYPTLVLGENGTAFAEAQSTSTMDGTTQVNQISSFDVNSGASGWSYHKGRLCAGRNSSDLRGYSVAV